MAARVAGLLVHYWTADDDKAMRRTQIADWVEDLKEFPLGAIEGAIITWRQQNSRRPTPADIRKLIVPDPKPEIEGGAAYNPLPRSRLTSAERQKHRNAVAPLWELVRRAKADKDADMLIAERKRMSEEMFARDPDLRRINALIEQEAEEEARREAASQGKPYRAWKPRVWSWSDRVAAAYRWMHAINLTMPRHVNENASIVRHLVECFEDKREPSERLKQFITESRAKETGSKVASSSLPPKREPVYPDTRSIEELHASLGVRATEQEQPP